MGVAFNLVYSLEFPHQRERLFPLVVTACQLLLDLAENTVNKVIPQGALAVAALLLISEREFKRVCLLLRLLVGVFEFPVFTDDFFPLVVFEPFVVIVGRVGSVSDVVLRPLVNILVQVALEGTRAEQFGHLSSCASAFHIPLEYLTVSVCSLDDVVLKVFGCLVRLAVCAEVVVFSLVVTHI